jgi:protein O-GlcNAc transferase
LRRELEQHIRNRDYRAALEISRALFTGPRADAEIAAMHGHVLQQLGMHREARAALQPASAALPRMPSIWIDLAGACIAEADWNAAALAVKRFRALAPTSGAGPFADAEIQLGLGQPDRAETLFRQAIAMHPGFLDRRLHLAGQAFDRRDFGLADWHYRGCIAQHPDSLRAHLDFLASLFHQRKFPLAAALARNAIARWPDNTKLLQRLSIILDLIESDPAERLAVRGQWLQHAPQAIDAHIAMANAQVAVGDLAAAHARWRSAQEIDPTHPLARWAALHYPERVVFDSDQEIEIFRQRWRHELQYYESAPTPDAGNCLRMIQSCANFRLVYVVDEILEPARRYTAVLGRFCDRVFGADTHHLPSPILRERRRIGVVSSNFGWHSVSRVWRDLMLSVERSRLELVCFKLDDTEDASIAEWRRRSDHFVETQGSLPEWQRCLAAADLDVVIFLDLGPDAVAQALATRRYAPVQCTTWAFPATSGLSTIDYYLSSDLMEPEQAIAQTHYSEALIRLPGLACSYTLDAPLIAAAAAVPAARQSTGIRFVCAQSHMKLLPAHDTLFARVLAQTPGARLALSHGGSDIASAALKARIGSALNAAGVESERVELLGQLPYARYLSLLAEADVVLDSLHFSGCLTALDALSLDLPIVTLPGTTMRSRQTAAMLRLLELPELIAADRDDYVRIATRLAEDDAWRSHVRQYIAARKHRLYDVAESVRGLQDFLCTVQPR